MNPAPPAVAPLPPHARWSFWASVAFWCRVVLETAGRRRLSRVLEHRLRGRPIDVTGVDHVPGEGGVVFAVNHYHAGLTIDVVAATLLSAELACAQDGPRLSDRSRVVVGRRPPRPTASAWRRGLRRVTDHVLRRWQTNVLCIPAITPGGLGPAASGGASTPSVPQLRAFRRAARTGPSLVFPEGAASRVLGDMRAGVGRWLGGLGVPTIPVGVHWHEDVGDRARDGWRVVFGAPLVWSPRAELRDLQLGLAMASLLPAELAPGWQELLARWREAHESA